MHNGCASGKVVKIIEKDVIIYSNKGCEVGK